jgi:hypothetical protein
MEKTAKKEGNKKGALKSAIASEKPATKKELKTADKPKEPTAKPNVPTDDKKSLSAIMESLKGYIQGTVRLDAIVKLLMTDVTAADERGLAFNVISLRAIVFYASSVDSNIVNVRSKLVSLFTACYIKQGKSEQWSRERAKKCVAPRLKKALSQPEFQSIQRSKLGLSD